MTIKRVVYGVADMILKPLGLKISYRIGNDPFLDMARLLPPAEVGVVIDGGAHHGSFSHQAATHYPAATIHAFEPTPTTYHTLSRNTRTVARVQTHEAALGSESGDATLYANASPLTNSLYLSASANEQYFAGLVAPVSSHRVKVVSLEDFCREKGCSRIDLVKLDLQGHELEAIRGLGSLLSTVQLVFLEVQFLPLYEGAPLFSEVETYLRRRGLAFYQFYELVRSPIDGRLLYGDAMFVREHRLFAAGV
jgi:FkbM family methyltransferase